MADKEGPNKMVCGLLAILLGSWGIHKFVMGQTTAGVIMLCVSLLTCGIGALIMYPIGIIEGIIYLMKSDEEFHQIYVVEKKAWF
ncbi:MAG: TM2 domain-containing protein [Planctomycetes bacterium]|nr:TM2 domain-containing protein [Planctomycetota bacterium]